MRTADTKFPKNALLIALIAIILSSLACNFSINLKDKAKPETEVVETIKPQNTNTLEPVIPTDIPPTSKPPSQTPTIKIEEVLPTTTIPPRATVQVIKPVTLPPQPTAQIMPDGITVTAATGNLFIRRGPGSIYNIVTGFLKGTTAKAVGRNEKSDWLAIEIPNTNGLVGWISMGTPFTQMNGSIQSLTLYPFEEAKPAYLQNCTLHDMTTRPGQWNLPAKTTQKVNPGEYDILDMSTGQSKVMDTVLKEGNTVSIKIDGGGISYGCP